MAFYKSVINMRQISHTSKNKRHSVALFTNTKTFYCSHTSYVPGTVKTGYVKES